MLGVVLLAWQLHARAEEPTSSPEQSSPQTGAFTLGGTQFWADELVYYEWRIQRNTVTGHCRLLDPKNRRRAWGSFENCRDQLAEIRRAESLPPTKGKVVLVLHGLGATRNSMEKLSNYLEKEGGYTVLQVTYPSTRAGIDQHARALASIVRHLETEPEDHVEQLNFVSHSLGNLVVRCWLAEQAAMSESARSEVPLGRFVMIAPPNHGAKRALLWTDRKATNGLFEFVLGESGKQLASDFDALQGKLATPDCQFGIVAGGRGDGQGWHAKIPGDDDGTVGVAETKLAGARDFVVVPVRHPFMKSDPRVVEYTLRFLKHGHFIAEDQRRPIPSSDVSPPRD
jgi:pimeloyl-ACP methyl ester carboxylesterase